jgi:hypothetical protein
LFIVKVFAGIAYAQFYKLPRYHANSDTWRFYRLSLNETRWLLADPFAFFKDLFTYGYSNGGNIFSGHDSYWNDLKSNIPVKLMAMMNVITNGSYYADIILFNVLFFVGCIALYRLMSRLFSCHKWVLIAAIFLLPSTLFWCSGIHKDGLIFSAMGLLLYNLYKLFVDRFAFSRLIIVVLCAIIVFSLRNYIVLALIPAAIAWGLSIKYQNKTALIYSVIFGFCVGLFILSFYLPSPFQLPLYIANKQHEFQQLSGESAITLTPLQPTLTSFASYFPKAVDMALLRPYIAEARNFSYLPAAVENLFVIGMLCWFLITHWRRPVNLHTWSFLLFSLSVLLIAGYTITFSGAIVRYRSFALPFLVAPLACQLWSRYRIKY